MPLVNRGEGTEEDRARWASFMTSRTSTSRLEPAIDMTVDDVVEEERVIPNFDAEQDLASR